jgi:hypothetical protein
VLIGAGREDLPYVLGTLRAAAPSTPPAPSDDGQGSSCDGSAVS